MKRYGILLLVTMLLSGAALSLRVAAEQSELASRLIRLHVVAASDSVGDQARKLAVRDALLPELAALTADCADAESAAAVLTQALPALEDSAARTLGTGEPAAASLGWERFPRRDYGSFSLPAGNYRALRITLGAGEGHNWWCVAFPALCLPAAEPEEEAAAFDEAAVAAGLTDSEIEYMRSDAPTVRFKFRVLDWLAELFGS